MFNYKRVFTYGHGGNKKQLIRAAINKSWGCSHLFCYGFPPSFHLNFALEEWFSAILHSLKAVTYLGNLWNRSAIRKWLTCRSAKNCIFIRAFSFGLSFLAFRHTQGQATEIRVRRRTPRNAMPVDFLVRFHTGQASYHYGHAPTFNMDLMLLHRLEVGVREGRETERCWSRRRGAPGGARHATYDDYFMEVGALRFTMLLREIFDGASRDIWWCIEIHDVAMLKLMFTS